jgi:hypothetical protein
MYFLALRCIPTSTFPMHTTQHDFLLCSQTLKVQSLLMVLSTAFILYNNIVMVGAPVPG